jgi:hypothetical protein
MKKILVAAAVICLAFNACKDPKAEEKVVLNDVIKIHDNVMGYEDQLMHNKMKLDTLLIQAKNDEAKASINQLTAKLARADAAMSDWMQNFDATQKGKTHEQIMAYLADQKKQVLTVDSIMKGAVKESTEYLKPFEKK